MWGFTNITSSVTMLQSVSVINMTDVSHSNVSLIFVMGSSRLFPSVLLIEMLILLRN